MKVKRSKKVLAALLTLCMMLFIVPFSVQAAGDTVTLDIAQGDITITSTGYTAQGATSETPFTGDYYIMQSNNTTTTENSVYITSGTHNITVDGLNIKATEGRIQNFIVGGTETGETIAEVNLTLVNDNILKGYIYSSGLAVSENSKLTIGGTGSLTATGDNAPGIGGYEIRDGDYYDVLCGTIVINSGTIIAKGDGGQPGIGGPGRGGNITINGGYINATYGTNGAGGAGIGGAGGKDGGTVTINGGTVVAKGYDNGLYYTAKRAAADIGGGYKFDYSKGEHILGDSGVITFNGGNITAVNNRIGLPCSNDNTYVPIAPKNNEGTSLYRTAITLDGAGENAKVVRIIGIPNGYGIKDIQTYTGGVIYLYLPENTSVTSVTLEDGTTYSGRVITDVDGNAASTFTIGGSVPEDRSATITANATIPSPTYTVTIPATVDVGELVQKSFNDAAKISSTPFTVSATSVDNLFGQKKVNVAVSTADGNFKLVDGSNELDYSVFNVTSGGTALTSGATFAEFTAVSENTGRIEIDQSAIDHAGNYTGTLTFTISLSDVIE